MSTAIRLFRDTYVDSVRQLAAARAMRQTPGVGWAAAAMGTPANVAILLEQGFTQQQIGQPHPGDLFIAVRADDTVDAPVADGPTGNTAVVADAVVTAALQAGESAMFAAHQHRGDLTAAPPRTLDRAVDTQPGTTIAVISVPGEYAALEAHKALARDLDVLLFSDNVTVEEEVRLKEHAARRGRLMMGPGAGTAMLAGTGLGFANVVSPGPVGVVAAAGTGAQEAMSLLDRWGCGVSQVIGLGGRDMSEAVGGRMASIALGALHDDPATEVILFVSKPPARAVAERVLSRAGSKPLVAALIGHDGAAGQSAAVHLADTLEGGVLRALELVGVTPPDPSRSRGPSVESVIERLAPTRTAVRGLYSGGTLCYEALVLLARTIGPVWSNTPIDKRFGLPAPPGASVCLDLGEEEFTRGRPHPMIDPEGRVEMLRELADNSHVAAIVLDVVLGHGAHPDPAGMLAPACARLLDANGPQVVAYVLGTDRDPQGYRDQVATLVDAGCLVTQTAARAALTAAAIATRNPSIATGPR
jgi:FdrA protein